jgi:hypothetical protein
MRKTTALVFILAQFLLGCAEKPYDPGRAPSAERMRALLDAPIKRPKDLPLTFEVTFMPRVTLAGRDVKVTCIVPPEQEAFKFRFGVPGLAMHEGAVTQAENSQTIEAIGCGTWTATCDIMTPTGQKHREAELISKGDCNSGTPLAGGSGQQ